MAGQRARSLVWVEGSALWEAGLAESPARVSSGPPFAGQW